MNDEENFQKLLRVACRLSKARIHYNLYHSRDDAVGIDVAVPGERWEIEFLADGTVEIERYRSDGAIGGEELLDELFRRFAD